MTALIAWLTGSSAVPTGSMVWVTGGMGIAIALGVMLLVTLALLASQHERSQEDSWSVPSPTTILKRPAAQRLPSAA